VNIALAVAVKALVCNQVHFH